MELTEEFAAAQAALYAKYPDCPKAGVIPCLCLTSTIDNAIEILCGRKIIEWRPLTEHNVNLFCEMKYFEYAEAHQDDDTFTLMSMDGKYIYDIEKVRFHDESLEWFLEVEIRSVTRVYATKENAKFFADTFNSHYLEKEVALCAIHPETDITEFFALELGTVLDTNLDEMPKDRKKRMPHD